MYISVDNKKKQKSDLWIYLYFWNLFILHYAELVNFFLVFHCQIIDRSKERKNAEIKHTFEKIRNVIILYLLESVVLQYEFSKFLHNILTPVSLKILPFVFVCRIGCIFIGLDFRNSISFLRKKHALLH